MWGEIAAKLDEPIAVGPPADELEKHDETQDGEVGSAMADYKCWNRCIAPALA